jgi:signal peptidase I
MKFLGKVERGFIWFFDIGRFVIVAAVLVIIFYYTLGQFFAVSGSSMEPNLHDGQWLLISKINHYYRSPKRGEVIVFHFPGTRNDKYIKRIIGLPGENVEVKKARFLLMVKSSTRAI